MSESDNRGRRRSLNYTPSERKLLLDLAAQYKTILSDKGSCAEMCRKKKKAWTMIAARYNQLCVTGKRTAAQLKHLHGNLNYRMQQKQKMKAEKSDLEYKNQKDNQNQPRIEHNILEDGIEQPGFVIMEEDSVSFSPDLISAQAEQDPVLTDSEEEGLVEELEKAPSEVSIPIPRDIKPERDKSISESHTEVSEHFMDIVTDPIQSKREVPLSAEALKRLYYKKKLVNAGLEHKKLLHEIFLLKKREKEESKEHELKLLFLKKKLHNL